MNPLTQFKKILILSLLIALSLIVVAPARATPSCGVIPVALAPTGHFPSGLLDLMCRDLPLWDLIMRVKGDSDVYIIQNTFPPGAHTGWHTHPGPSLITVVSGELTVYDAADPTCTPHVYHAGESFTDIGCGDVHNIRNETGAEAKTIAVQIVPHGATRRIDAADPGCAQVPPCPAF